jgi:pilus assembly protein Flp/PilA
MKGIRMLNYLRKVMHSSKEHGASAVEYGLMVAAIAAVIVGIVFGLGGVVKEVFTTTCTTIQTNAAPEGNCAGAGGVGDGG